MLVHGSVAKLNQHIGNNDFEDVLDALTAAQDEGLSRFELDVRFLSEEETNDLMTALDTLGYGVDFDLDALLMEVRYE